MTTATVIILLFCSPIFLGIFYGMTKDMPSFAALYSWWDRATAPITHEQAQIVGSTIVAVAVAAGLIWLVGMKPIVVLLVMVASIIGGFSLHSWYHDRKDGLQ